MLETGMNFEATCNLKIKQIKVNIIKPDVSKMNIS